MLTSVTLTEFGYRAIKDGVSIDVPNSPENSDYQIIQDWIAKGGVVTTTVTPPTTTAPNWRDWRLAMMDNASYNDLATRAESGLTPSSRMTLHRLETALSMSDPHIPTIKALWANLLKQTPYNPSNTAIAQWKALAAQYKIPFTFDDKGLIT